jgi:alpha-beta hydrolase superfamily lysophospholipase
MTNDHVASGRRTRHSLALLLALTALFTAGACSADPSSTTSGTAGPGGSTGTTNPADNTPSDAFYVAPDPLPGGEPGDLIRSEPLAGAPAGSQAWRILYLSTGIGGSPVAVSGVVIAPTSTTAAPSGSTPGSTPGSAPAGTAVAAGRPILSWAHPTTGVVDDCAPSTMPEVFELIPGLSAFLDAGYVVAATDYEGLGTAGVHPYLVGESEGRSVLDAARAARDLPEAGAGDELLLWGHSQGGQASLFAGQLAPTYAPDLTLVATAAAAPAGELQQLLNDDATTATGVVLGAYAINAYLEVFGPEHRGMALDQVVTSEGGPAIAEIIGLCNLTQDQQILDIATPLAGTFYVDDPGSVEPWQTLLNENTAGQTTIDSPVFIAQGEADTVVIPDTTAELAKAYCGLGVDVTLKSYPGVTHELIGYKSAADVAAWMAEVLAGSAPPGTCGTT